MINSSENPFRRLQSTIFSVWSSKVALKLMLREAFGRVSYKEQWANVVFSLRNELQATVWYCLIYWSVWFSSKALKWIKSSLLHGFLVTMSINASECVLFFSSLDWLDHNPSRIKLWEIDFYMPTCGEILTCRIGRLRLRVFGIIMGMAVQTNHRLGRVHPPVIFED